MRDEGELPEGWTEVFLRDCADVLDGRRVPVSSAVRANRHGSVPYYGATGQVGWIDDYLFDEELVLLGEDGAPFLDPSKNVAYVIRGKAWVNNHAHVLRARPTVVVSQFLEHSLNAFRYDDWVNGTTRLKLTQGAMNRIPIRMPPIPEQLRIVEAAGRALSAATVARQRLSTTSSILRRFRQAVLSAAFNGRLTQARRAECGSLAGIRRETREREWSRQPLGAFIKSMANGIYKPDRFYSSSGIPCLRMYNIKNGELSLHNLKRMELSREEVQTYELLPGDILVNRVNSRELVGKAALVTGLPERTVFESKNIRLRLTAGTLEPRFVNYFLLSEEARRSLTGDSKQTVGMATISQGHLRGLLIPVPPPKEREEIVCRVEALFALADAIEKRVAAASARADKLTQAILAKAFRGELVPTEAELNRRRQAADAPSAASPATAPKAPRRAR